MTTPILNKHGHIIGETVFPMRYATPVMIAGVTFTPKTLTVLVATEDVTAEQINADAKAKGIGLIERLIRSATQPQVPLVQSGDVQRVFHFLRGYTS